MPIETTCELCGTTSEEVMTYVNGGTLMAENLGVSGCDVCDGCLSRNGF